MATNSQALLADEILGVYGNINDLQLDMQLDPRNNASRVANDQNVVIMGVS